MSILAAEGVGVFDQQHIGILQRSSFEVFENFSVPTTAGKPEKRRLGTHIFAWDALAEWCESEIRPTVDLLELFSVKGKTFRELVQGFHPNASKITTNAITKKWLLKWALDVKKYRFDREIRNNVTYRPQTINKFKYRFNAKSAMQNVFKVFQTLSPIGRNSFYYLDIELLRRLLTNLYENNASISNSDSFEDLLERAFMSLGERLDRSTRTLLTRLPSSESIPLLFTESKKRGKLPLPVISRATLLLRVATGFFSKILNDSNIDKKRLGFIWRAYGVNNGFWSPSAPIDDYSKLWIEVEAAYSNVSDDIDLSDTFLQPIREKFGEAYILLSQFNRAVLWGI